jgi:hypothetical protein
MSTEVMTQEGQFIVIPKKAWGMVPIPSWPRATSGGTKGDGAEPSFVDIMNEQLAEKIEEEEFDRYISETYETLSNDFVNFESDQEYSLLLKSCLDQELNQRMNTKMHIPILGQSKLL